MPLSCKSVLIFFVFFGLHIDLSECAAVDQCSTTVNLPALGRVKGSITRTAVTGQMICQFLGVPYAEPTRGTNRYKPPTPIKPWNGTLDASEYGSPCPVITLYNEQAPSKWFSDIENCLHLSIYTKALTDHKPVMFWIHGGGFTNGSSLYHPPQFLLEGEIVLVSAQYRLGAFGFASTNTSLIPGNAAVHDLILALEWVQKNIGHFGGDAGRVTVFGQSAGAALAGLLIISPAVPDHYIHRAILQSGSITANWAYTSNSAAQAFKIAREAGCKATANTEDVTYCLLKLNAFHLLKTTMKESFAIALADLKGTMPALPQKMVQKKKRVTPVMAGTTKHDGSFVIATFLDRIKMELNEFGRVPFTGDLIKQLLKSAYLDSSPAVFSQALLKMFFTKDQLFNQTLQDLIPGLIDMAGTITMKSPVLEFVQLNANLNPNQTFLYTFDYKGQHTRFGYGSDTRHLPFLGGVHHSDDNLYLFPTEKLNTKDMEISKMMVELWTSFAANGRPTAKRVTSWPPVTEMTGPYLRIDENPTLGDDYMDEFTITIKENGKYVTCN